jgi:exodeoxyribonuclease VII large subunit
VRARPALTRLMQQRETALASQGKLLETLSYQATLKRGYALVRDDAGKLVRSAGPAASAASLKISFADGDVTAVPAGSSGSPPTPASKPVKPKPKGQQGSLF